MMSEAWDLPEVLITAIADHHGAGSRAPVAVEAVATIRQSDPPDPLESLRMHCAGTLDLDETILDPLLESALAESTSLADSMAPRG